jgi:uncharacterized protein DUF4105
MARHRQSAVRKVLRSVATGLIWVVAVAVTIWAGAALWFDLPFGSANLVAVLVYAAVIVALVVLVSGARLKALACLACFALVLGWWLTIDASNDRHWQEDVAQTAWAEFNGDQVTIHNVRNFDYRTEQDYAPNWETRTYNLQDIRGADMFITFWGSPWIAHPIVSFQFGDKDHVAISVETRKEVGEDYSALRGFFRQYELIYIVGDERDLVRLRTNYRKGEEVYLYRSTATPEAAKAIFVDYLRGVNKLHETPAFYNAVTSNCTTNIRLHAGSVLKAVPWDWRLLLNGKSDEFAYQYGRIVGGMPFEQLKQRAHINEAARAAGNSEQFSELIRVGRPGF